MYQIQVVGMRAHGDCPECEYEGIWLRDQTARLVRLTPDRKNARRFASMADAVQTQECGAMKYFVMNIVKTEEDR